MKFYFASSLCRIKKTVVHDSKNMLSPAIVPHQEGHSDQRPVREWEVTSLQEQEQPPK